jgi:D-glycero-D-manno-heptose 1,7-bisphosphate phosphatase
MKKAAFLDRDGVINFSYKKDGKPYPPRKIEEVKIMPNVPRAIELLLENEYLPIVITNQPDIARGKVTAREVNLIHDFIRKETGISHFYICPHDDSENCRCRKPKPGLIVDSAKELDINLKQSILVGDRWKDVSAGQSVNLKTYFIDYDYNEKKPEEPYFKVTSLLDAVQNAIGDIHATNAK